MQSIKLLRIYICERSLKHIMHMCIENANINIENKEYKNFANL